MMNRKILVVVLAIALVLTSCSVTNAEVTPVVIRGNGLLPELSIDDKINQAEIIIIGQVESTLPSKWKKQNEKDIKNATPQEIFEFGLFTDSIISVDQILKGDYKAAAIRVRSYIGETEQVQLVNESEPIFEKGQIYLLFLEKDIGPTAIVDPGDYISVNSDAAVYEIVGDKAISADDEWVLDELIAYIENSLSTITSDTSGSATTTDWDSSAMTVNELTLESNLVVRVRVSEAPVTRVVRHELSIWDKNNKIVDTTVSETLFSDTVFEIIKTYRGKSQLNITVMQTGGFDSTISSSIEEMADDPLYKIGEEYILFLVDISGDKVQAPDRELYRIVNPFGRYRVDGEGVFSYGENLASVSVNAIKNVSELEAQIEQAINLIPIPVP